MSLTFADAIARRGGKWVIALQIDGLVDPVLGGITLCSAVPAAFKSNPQWKPLLADWPKTLTERVDPLGGTLQAGQYNFTVLDKRDYLTGLFKWDSDAIGTLLLDVSSTATTLALSGTVAIASGQYLFLGTEVVQATAAGDSTSIPGRTSVVVTRGYGTRQTRHFNGDAVRASMPRLEGRNVTLILIPYDATDVHGFQVLEQYQILQVGLTDDWTGWTFKCATRVMSLLKTVGDASQGQYQATQISQQRFLSARIILPTGVAASPWLNPDGTFEPQFFLLDGKEIFLGQVTGFQPVATGSAIPGVLQIDMLDRAKLGTSTVSIDEGAIANGPLLALPLVADLNDGIGSFRYSPGPTPSTTRATTSTWVQSDHWVDILLCLLTSSKNEEDGLELVNYTSGFANWSCLPVGWGAGIPASNIDFASFLAVKERTPDYHFSGFVMSASIALNDLLATEFLQPTGAFLVSKVGKLALVLPRLPVVGAEQYTLGTGNILREPAARGTYRPRATGSFDLGSQIGGILLKLSGPEGEPVQTLLTAGDFDGLAAGQDATGAAQVITITVTSLRASQAGVSSLLEDIALRRLLRYRFPPFLCEVLADLSLYPSNLGDIFSLSLPFAPNARTGTRGVVGMQCSAIEREYALDLAGDIPGIRMVLLAYAFDVRAGRVAPSAAVASWSSPTATIVANRYTDTGAIAGLTSDIAQWRVGQRLKVVNQNGSLASPSGAYQTIVSINTGTNAIVLDGNWSGLNPTGKILKLADYDSAAVTDQGRYVAAADQATQTVGSSARSPWLYGEP